MDVTTNICWGLNDYYKKKKRLEEKQIKQQCKVSSYDQV
jgi:hypothetical protein